MKILTTPVERSFNYLRQIHNGIEFWSAREIQKIIGYTSWKYMKTLVNQTWSSIEAMGEDVNNYIVKIDKMTTSISGIERMNTAHDYLLTRAACYLLMQHADSTKSEVVSIKLYFAQELAKRDQEKQSSQDKTRLETREEVVQQNKKLFSTARKHGVKDFSSFNNAGYMGLYGMRHQQLVNYKGVGRKKLLDKSSLQELVVNLSRITQTKDALIAENIQGQERAEQIHFTVGEKIRKQLQGSQGLLPEDLSLLVSIKIIEKAITQVIVSVSSIIVIQGVIRLGSVTAKRKNKRNKNTYILGEITP